MNSLRFTLAVGETHNSGKIKLLYPKILNSKFKIFVGATMLSISPITEEERDFLFNEEMTSFGKMSFLIKTNYYRKILTNGFFYLNVKCFWLK